MTRGNNDKDWAEAIPHDLTVTLEGVRFYMVHNKKGVPADLTGAQAHASRHGATLTVVPGAEHWFHTSSRLAALQAWERENS